MWARAALLVSVCLLALGPLSSVLAQPKPKRVALVIGNDAYDGATSPKGLTKLDNPVRDAHAIAVLLEKHGFAVTSGYDLDRDRFARMLQGFARTAAGADTALVFYAGHGMEVIDPNQLDIFNVLAPTNAEIDCETLAHFNTVKLDEITAALRGVKNQIVILDACRNNPFPGGRCQQRGEETRSHGFRAPDVKKRRGEAMLIAYSTAQKSFARDGAPGSHSPFAQHLLSVLADNPTANFFPLMNQIVVTSCRE